MAEVPTGGDAVPHELLELHNLGEAAGLLAREDLLAGEPHLEYAALGVGHEGDADSGDNVGLPAPAYAVRTMELPEGAVESILRGWPVASLATLGERGQPHVVPIVFARIGGEIWSPIDGKPKAGGELVRIRNVRRDPRISLLLEHYEEDWTRLWWLRVDGEAEVVALAGSRTDREVEAALAALRRKYPQYEEVPLIGPSATLLRMRIGSLRGWCASASALARTD